MRDVLLTAIVFGLLPFVFWRPELGIYLWAWLSLMSPHKLAFGFAHGIPFAYIVAIVTLVALAFSSRRKTFPLNAVTTLQIALLCWMSITSLFALNDSSIVFDRWLFVLKIQLMMFVTFMLLRGRREIETLLWIVTFSVGFYGIKGGIWTVATGGGGRVWGPPGGMIEGNNELAVALVMVIPFMYYLSQLATRRWVRMALFFCLGAMSISVLGSQSRGALLALVTMMFFLGLKGRHPIRTSVLLGVLLASAIAFMPQSWSNRMESMQNYQADNSAMSRLRTWETLFRAAVDRPLVGVGFGADSRLVFDRYAPRGDEFEGFSDGVFVAHSIYFQMLGEHGFVGLALFLIFWVAGWRRAESLAKKTRGDPEFGSWVPLLMQMVKVSLIGYGVGGAFLSLAYFDLPYYVIGFVLLVEATVRESARTKAVPAGDPAGNPSGAAPLAVESRT
jgi:probable O-glycosylation ligase (exosortase A-associated)